jgi:methionyl-tRNA formyltransferase
MTKKIVFMGTPEFSIQTLEVLVKSKYQIEYVYTQPPKKSERGKKINTSPIHKIAEKLNIKIKNPTTLDNENEFKHFKAINPYIVVVVAYGQIIPKRYLTVPEKGFINIHASLLPKWRGAAPIQRAIMNGDKETGISFMKIEEGLDTGPYMSQIKVKIDEKTTSESLGKILSKLGSENILKCIKQIEEGSSQLTSQDTNKVTYAKKIKKTESKIEWNKKAISIVSKINGLNPFPGAWFEHKNTRYKIWKAEVSNLSGEEAIILNNDLTIGCKDKSVKILEIQKEGKARLITRNFLTGGNLNKGDKVS